MSAPSMPSPLADLLTVKPDDRGPYALVVTLLRQYGGRLADDKHRLAKLCDCPVRAWTACRDRLIAAGKLVVHDGFLSNPVVSYEVAARQRLRDISRQNGLKGGNPRLFRHKRQVNEIKDLAKTTWDAHRATGNGGSIPIIEHEVSEINNLASPAGCRPRNGTNVSLNTQQINEIIDLAQPSRLFEALPDDWPSIDDGIEPYQWVAKPSGLNNDEHYSASENSPDNWTTSEQNQQPGQPSGLLPPHPPLLVSKKEEEYMSTDVDDVHSEKKLNGNDVDAKKSGRKKGSRGGCDAATLFDDQEVGNKPVVDRQRVCDEWNRMADQHHKPKVRLPLSSSRVKKLNVQIRALGVADVVRAIWAIPKDNFLLNGKDTWGGADFDYLLKPDKCVNILEKMDAKKRRPSRSEEVNSWANAL